MNFGLESGISRFKNRRDRLVKVIGDFKDWIEHYTEFEPELLLRIFDLLDPIRARIADGLPVLGTCAGMILLADRILGGTEDQETIGGLDVTVRRNAFGRQVDSFEEDLDFKGLADPVHAVFIRAPWIEEVGSGVEILAESAGRIVAARQSKLMVTSFHPEMGNDERVHDYFLSLIKS